MQQAIQQKDELRKAMRERRRALTDQTARELSLAAQQHVIRSDAWKEAPSVGLYVAVRRETDTDLLLETAWNEGKEVYLPHTPLTPAGVMHFLPCASRQALVVNHYGIPEPSPEPCPVPPEGGWVPDLVIVPGTVFDRKGYRIGSGGGYYDRIFAKPSMRDVPRIGLAYSFQVVDAVPAEPWDKPMHAIATEKGITWL